MPGKLWCSTDAANSANPAGAGTCGTSTNPSGDVIIPAAMTEDGESPAFSNCAINSRRAFCNRWFEPSRAVSRTPTGVCVFAMSCPLRANQTRVFVVPASTQTSGRLMLSFSFIMKNAGQSWTISADEANLRLDKWLAAPDRLGSRSRALDAIAKGKVFINEMEQSTDDSSRKLQEGETVRLWMDRPGSAQRRYSERHSSGLHLLYEDASIIVVNKPPGLLSVPLASQPNQPSVLDQIKTHLRSHRKLEPLVVHRIDRDTSGIVLFAKTHDAQHKLKDQFQRHEATRIYLAIVTGHPVPEAGTWRALLIWVRAELEPQRADRRPRPVKG